MYNPDTTNNWRSDIDVNETITVAHSSDGPVPLRRTFLFTDIEGSYRQWERHPEGMPRALAVHDDILQQTVGANRGRIFKTIGDAVCAVFTEPLDGVRAAIEAQRALHGADWASLGLSKPLTVRMAVQTGEVQEREGDYAGLVLNRISRLLRAGHGGQVLLTGSVADDIQRVAIAGVRARDLGERRLRDVPGSSRIYQLEIDGLPSVFAPLETLDTIAHNLPVALNTCLDRESELAQIRRLLLDTPARLVTLLGPGGIGKTRLALHAATQLIDAFPGGIWFVDLSGIRDAGLTPTAIATVLGVRVEPGDDTNRAMGETIGDAEMLLVLDNCEQIVDGVARCIASVLPNAPGLRVLATSRVPLELRGEQRIDIGPLPIEKNEDAGPAVQLFIERAQQIRPAFEMTAANQESVYEICRRVDGIPLALELAAARVAVLSPEALRNRLSSRLSLLTSTNRDLPERHQTLRGAIAWSYALLRPEEQVAFRALSVFQGGWSLAGAQAVTGLDDVETMEILGSLRDKSLVRLSETDDGDVRYSMLETIQEYGFEQLTQIGEVEAIRALHLTHFVALSEEASDYIEGGPRQMWWLAVTDREIANVRVALQWGIDSGQVEQALDLCINLWFYWSQRGLADEGQRWFERALSLAAEIDPVVRSGAFQRLGNLCIERGELASAEALYRAAREISDATQHLRGMAVTRLLLGMVAGLQGRSEKEHDLQIEALELSRQLASTRYVASSLLNLAIWARNQGKPGEALEYLGQVVDLQMELEDEPGIAFSQAFVARVREDLDELDVAASLLEDAERTFAQFEIEEGLCLVRMHRASVELKRGNLALATVMVDDARSAAQERGDKVMQAAALETSAMVNRATGRLEEAAMHLGAAHYLRQRTGSATSSIDCAAILETKSALESTLGSALFALNWERGRQHQARIGWTEVASPNLIALLDLPAGDQMQLEHGSILN